MSLFLLLIGLGLIFLEFYLPGAILGIIGSVAILASVFLFASQAPGVLWIILYVIGVAISIGAVVRFALWRIAKPNSSIYLSKDQEGYQASSYDHTAIGKKGIVLSDLKPGGYIVVEGKQQAAISLTGYLPKGTEVLVVSGQGESLMVQSLSKQKE